MKGHGPANGQSTAPSSGFVAVNANRPEREPEDNSLASQFMFSHSNTDNITIINGTSIKGASPTMRADLMKKFFTTADRQARGYDEAPGTTNPIQPRPRLQGSDPAEYSIWNTHNTNGSGSGNNSSNIVSNANSTPVAIPGTPSSLLPPPKNIPQEKDDGGPFKLEMVARMEELQRGERVNPPCDRCRRLHMDCLKNLTACMGCTKKHAKCSWRDVKEDELRAVWGPSAPHDPREVREPYDRMEDDRLPPLNLPGLIPSPGAPISAERERYGRSDRSARPSETPSDLQYSQHNRRESAPGAGHISPRAGVSMSLPTSEKSTRRAMSETEGGSRGHHYGPSPRHAEDEDPDANQRLMQAILDTVDHHARVAAAVQEKERGAERAGENQSNAQTDRDTERERERERERDRDHDRHLVQA